MKQISIRNDFSISDLGDLQDVKSILETVNIGKNNNVKLNLRHCFIDYPATSILIDLLMNQLKKRRGKKELIIEHDYYLPESTILNLLLLGSEYFSIRIKKELSLEELKHTILSTIERDNISIEINVVDRAGELIKTFKYE